MNSPRLRDFVPVGSFLARRRDEAGDRWRQARDHLLALDTVTSPGFSVDAHRRARIAIGKAWSRVEFWDRLLVRWSRR